MTNIIDISTKPDVLHSGLAFGEGPRYYKDALYFSDMHAHQVLKFAPETGAVSIEVELDEEPSGLGWLPNGDMVIVGMTSRSLLRLDQQNASQAPKSKRTLETWVDLSGLAPGLCNDMVMLPSGAAYVGNFGYDMHAGEKFRPTQLIYVTPDGEASHCAKDLVFPNGTVISPDGKTLVIAETFGGKLTSYAVADDGSLSDREVWAALPQGAVPDGICLDEAGGVWVASPTTNECLRMERGGNVSHRVGLDRGAFACMLGGTDLYILTAESSKPDECKAQRAGQLVRVEAPFSAAGYP